MDASPSLLLLRKKAILSSKFPHYCCLGAGSRSPPHITSARVSLSPSLLSPSLPSAIIHLSRRRCSLQKSRGFPPFALSFGSLTFRFRRLSISKRRRRRSAKKSGPWRTDDSSPRQCREQKRGEIGPRRARYPMRLKLVSISWAQQQQKRGKRFFFPNRSLSVIVVILPGHWSSISPIFCVRP